MSKNEKIIEGVTKFQKLVDEMEIEMGVDSKNRLTILLGTMKENIANSDNPAYIGEALERISNIENTEELLNGNHYLQIALRFYWKMSPVFRRNNFKWSENTDQFSKFIKRVEDDTYRRTDEYRIIGELCILMWRMARHGLFDFEEGTDETMEDNEEAIIRHLQSVLSNAEQIDEIVAIIINIFSMNMNAANKKRFIKIKKVVVDYMIGKKINISNWDCCANYYDTGEFIEPYKIIKTANILKLTKKEVPEDFLMELKKLSKIGDIVSEEDLPNLFKTKTIAAFMNVYLFACVNNIVGDRIGEKKQFRLADMCLLFRNVLKKEKSLTVNDCLRMMTIMNNGLHFFRSKARYHWEWVAHPSICKIDGYRDLFSDFQSDDIVPDYNLEGVHLLKEYLNSFSIVRNPFEKIDFVYHFDDFVEELFYEMKKIIEAKQNSSYGYYLLCRYYEKLPTTVKKDVMEIARNIQFNTLRYIQTTQVSLAINENKFYDSEVSKLAFAYKVLNDEECADVKVDILNQDYLLVLFSATGDIKLAKDILKKAFGLYDFFAMTNTHIPSKYDDYFKSIIEGILRIAQNPENSSLLAQYPVCDLMLSYRAYQDYILAIYNAPELRRIEDISEDDYCKIVIDAQRTDGVQFNFILKYDKNRIFSEIRSHNDIEKREEYEKFISLIKECNYYYDMISTYEKIDDSDSTQKDTLFDEFYKHLAEIQKKDEEKYPGECGDVMIFIFRLRHIKNLNKKEVLELIDCVL